MGMKREIEIDIEGDYGFGWEMVTCETSWVDARETIKAYRENEPGIRFRLRKVSTVKKRAA